MSFPLLDEAWLYVALTGVLRLGNGSSLVSVDAPSALFVSVASLPSCSNSSGQNLHVFLRQIRTLI